MHLFSTLSTASLSARGTVSWSDLADLSYCVAMWKNDLWSKEFSKCTASGVVKLVLAEGSA